MADGNRPCQKVEGLGIRQRDGRPQRNDHQRGGGTQKAQAKVEEAVDTLDKNPTDPAANLAVGKYRCFTKNQWNKGIPMLALGDDPALKDLALKELKGLTDALGQAKLGDAWWDLGERKNGLAQKNIQGHAASWYRQALPGLTGLATEKVEKRLKTIETRHSSSTFIYTFSSRDAVRKDFDVEGGWDVVSNELVLTGEPRLKATSKTLFSFPISVEYQMYMLPDRPYDLHAGFAGVRLDYATFANTRTILWVGGRQTDLPNEKAIPNHLYRILLVIDRETYRLSSKSMGGLFCLVIWMNKSR